MYSERRNSEKNCNLKILYAEQDEINTTSFSRKMEGRATCFGSTRKISWKWPALGLSELHHSAPRTCGGLTIWKTVFPATALLSFVTLSHYKTQCSPLISDKLVCVLNTWPRKLQYSPTCKISTNEYRILVQRKSKGRVIKASPDDDQCQILLTSRLL